MQPRRRERGSMTTLQLVETTQDPELVKNKHELELREQANAHRMAWFREWRTTVGVTALIVAVVALHIVGQGVLAERLLTLAAGLVLGAAMKPKQPPAA